MVSLSRQSRWFSPIVCLILSSTTSWGQEEWAEVRGRLGDSIAMEGSEFGFAMDSDRAWLAIGAPNLTGTVSRQGGVVLYRPSKGGWSEAQVLWAPDPEPRARFGEAVSIHGDRILVGAPKNDTGERNRGRAYVFQWGGSQWAFEQALDPGDGNQGDRFGASVSLASDFALVGAPDDADQFPKGGAAYVFRWSSTWTETDKIDSPVAQNGVQFGTAVCTDGVDVYIGAPGVHGGGANRRVGRAYGFSEDSTGWLLEDSFERDDHEGRFGSALAMSEEHLWIGAPSSVNSPLGGVVDAYDRTSGNWVSSFSAGTVPGNEFGASIAVHDDGDWLLVGAPGLDENGATSGEVHLFRRSEFVVSSWEDVWSRKGTEDGMRFGGSTAFAGALAMWGAPEGDGPVVDSGLVEFGWIIAPPTDRRRIFPPSADGLLNAVGTSIDLSDEFLFVGATLDDDKAINAGSVHVFARSGRQWRYVQELYGKSALRDQDFGSSISHSGDKVAIGSRPTDQGREEVVTFRWGGNRWGHRQVLRRPDGTEDNDFGHHVALEGDSLLIGADGDHEAEQDAGAVYSYVWSGSEWVFEAKLLPPPGEGREFGIAFDLDGGRAVIGAPLSGGAESGSVHTYVRDATGWVLEQSLRGSDLIQGDRFGGGISLDGSRLAVGAPRSHINRGSIFMFELSDGTWVETARLEPDEGVNIDFGEELALEGDHLIAALEEIEDEYGIGGVFVARHDGSAWVRGANFGKYTQWRDAPDAVALLRGSAYLGLRSLPQDDGAVTGGVVEMDLANLTLSLNDATESVDVASDGILSAVVQFGAPFSAAQLFVIAVNGVPRLVPIAQGIMSDSGRHVWTLAVPENLVGLDLKMQVLGTSRDGLASRSPIVEARFR